MFPIDPSHLGYRCGAEIGHLATMEAIRLLGQPAPTIPTKIGSGRIGCRLFCNDLKGHLWSCAACDPDGHPVCQILAANAGNMNSVRESGGEA